MSRRGHRPPGQRGQVLVLVAFALPVLLTFVGVAIDGSRLFSAQLAAQQLADDAAAAGAQAVDVSGAAQARTERPAQLIGGRGREAAYTLASEVLDMAPPTHMRWHIDVQPRVVTVTVEREVDLAFMPIAGWRTQTVVARSVAGPLNGINEAIR